MESHDLTVLSIGDQVPEDVLAAGTDPTAEDVTRAVASGRPVLVTLGGEGAGLLAAAAVYAWLGVRHFRAPATAAAELRQVLDMVAAIQGTRPPVLSRRGLA